MHDIPHADTLSMHDIPHDDLLSMHARYIPHADTLFMHDIPHDDLLSVHARRFKYLSMMVGGGDALRLRRPSSGEKKPSTPCTRTDWPGRNSSPKLISDPTLKLVCATLVSFFL